jgi:hypothetical protein
MRLRNIFCLNCQLYAVGASCALLLCERDRCGRGCITSSTTLCPAANGRFESLECIVPSSLTVVETALAGVAAASGVVASIMVQTTLLARWACLCSQCVSTMCMLSKGELKGCIPIF